MRNSRHTTIGMVIRSKYGEPTVICSPLTAWAISGNTVPSSTTSAKAPKSRLLARKAPSRDTGESMAPGERSRSPRQAIRPTAGRHHDPEEAEQGRPDPGVVERVDRFQHPRSGQERGQDGQAERGHHQRQVPDPQHAPPLLHHHRVEVGGGREPRQEGGVLDRVPRPVAAPAEDLVAPPRAEDHPAGQERPGEEGPAPGLDQPPLTHPAGDEAGAGEGEGDGEADQTEVEQRRVERHQDVVLQQRVRTGAVGRAWPR